MSPAMRSAIATSPPGKIARLLAALSFAALAGVSTACCGHAQAAGSVTPDVTHLRVTSQVILSGVTRLGVNLGEQNFYDSGQMLRNLLARNPRLRAHDLQVDLPLPNRRAGALRGFAAGNPVPGGFLERRTLRGAVGAAAGQRGTVTASGTGAGGYFFTLDSAAKAIGAGDWLAVEKESPGDPAAGWWPTVRGGARLEAERSDLPPGTPVHQALRIEASGAVSPPTSTPISIPWRAKRLCACAAATAFAFSPSLWLGQRCCMCMGQGWRRDCGAISIPTLNCRERGQGSAWSSMPTRIRCLRRRWRWASVLPAARFFWTT